MSVRIRLKRFGTKKRPFYRIVVMDSRTPRDGRAIEEVGFYNPRTQPADLRIDRERVDYWVGRGAQLSETVRTLLAQKK